MKYPSGIRGRLLLLAAISTLPTFALLLYDGWHTREGYIEAARQNLHARAKAAAYEVGRDIRGTQFLLHSLAELPGTLHQTARSCEEQVRKLGASYAETGSLFRLSPDGTLLCTSVNPAAGGVNLSDRDYFIGAMSSDAAVVGKPIRSRADSSRHVLPVALALRDDGGEPQEVLALGIGLNQYAASVASPTASSTELALWDESGRLLYRWPESRRRSGDGAAAATLGKAMVATGFGSLEHRGLDGMERVYGVDRVFGSDFILSLSTTREELLAGQRDPLIRNLIILLLIATAAFGIAWFLGHVLIHRPLSTLARLAERMSAGDLKVRTGMRQSDDEVGLLARAFDAMASTLSSQFESLSRSEQQLRESLAQVEQGERRVRQQLRHMRLLDEITRAIHERLDLASIFQVVVRSIEESLAADFCCIGLQDPATSTVRIEHIGSNSRDHAEAAAIEERIPIDIESNGLAQAMAGEFVYEPDCDELRFPFVRSLARAGLHSFTVAPLRSESSVMGFLLVAREQANAFTSSECEFLRQLSEHVALAMQQARLHTALQQAYDDLRQTQQVVMQEERLRALGQMASGIAHDINNALSPVSLYTTSLLEGEPSLSERARGYLETIQRAVDDVAETVARMREFYRKREEQVNLVPVSLNEVVGQVVELTRPRWSDMAQRHGTHIRQVSDLAPDLPRIYGIESEIREALTNLMLNAVDAMPQGGTLTLRTRRLPSAPDGVSVEVVDDGVGMSAEARERCLEPFFTTKGERGTGLGLAMVFGIVQRHGASLEIDSAAGAGTTVRIVFPGSALAPDTNGSGGVPERAAATRLRLLIVDDDPILLRSLRDALEQDGHVVTSANGGQEGIVAFHKAMASTTPVHMVITDLGMPEVDGHKVTAEIKKVSPATPVIMLTGWGRRLAEDGAPPLGVDRLLSKPPKLGELRRVLTELQCTATEGKT